ncbi:hydroxyacid dehydrogenase [Microbacterium sp. ISL-103]|uniref:hydroxyacid dehydrogenase n=1 Tax=Microbacterium sp. ISL-103 TaxID=2819156 RepID=UPI001BE6FEEE|nr:hydroxyacid dehydrogenase [Microbacterium sp. ISL-103]MBT2474022.1 hydroxyacid dehydrogenase [Microbacterium sp. ISL-103]
MNSPIAAFALEDEALIPQLFTPQALTRLRALVRLDERPIAPADPGALRAATDAEILITGWGAPALDAGMLDALPRLRAVFHAAGTVKRIVSPELWERGIRVSSSADANAVPVAEYTLAMILLSAKSALASADAYRRVQDMSLARPRGDVGAFGITVGIVGASRIGRRVLDLLRPFDIATVLYDPSLSAVDAAALGTTLVSLPDLLRVSDIVSLHAPSLPATYRMLGAAELATMRDGATLINTARGSLVDTDALVAELTTGRLRAVLDVTDPEPLPAGHPLFSAPGVTLTPHIAGSLGNELRRMGSQTVDEIERFVTTGSLGFEVRHRDLATIA